jgi:hypothetical protein
MCINICMCTLEISCNSYNSKGVGNWETFTILCFLIMAYVDVQPHT